MSRGTLTTITAAAILLTSCSSSGGADTAQGTPDLPLTDDQAVQLLHELDFWQGSTTTDLAEYAEGVCELYDIDLDPDESTLQILKVMTDAGMPADQASATLVYSTGWKCPEHYDKPNLTD